MADNPTDEEVNGVAAIVSAIVHKVYGDVAWALVTSSPKDGTHIIGNIPAEHMAELGDILKNSQARSVRDVNVREH